MAIQAAEVMEELAGLEEFDAAAVRQTFAALDRVLHAAAVYAGEIAEALEETGWTTDAVAYQTISKFAGMWHDNLFGDGLAHDWED